MINWSADDNQSHQTLRCVAITTSNRIVCACRQHIESFIMNLINSCFS